MEKLILLWLPLQGDVQCRHISPESYIVIICKLISTCDLMRRGLAWGGREEPIWKTLFQVALRGSYYITVLYGKPITNGDSIWTLIAFLNSFSQHTNKNNNTEDMSGLQGFSWDHDFVLCIRSTTTTKPFSLIGSKQPWLKSRRGGTCLKMCFMFGQLVLSWISIWSIFFSKGFCPGLKGGRQWLKGRWLTNSSVA